MDEVAKGMAELIPEGIEVLAGLEMGAIPIVTMLSHYSGIPAAFVRKKAKEHGTARLAEGTDVKGKKVLVVEDVVTSGGQIILSTNDLRDLGASVSQVLVVIDRKEGGREALQQHNIEMISLLNRDYFSSFSDA